MFIVSRPQPRSTNSCSAGAITSAAVLPAAYAFRNAQKPSMLMRTLSRTDSSSASDLTARAMVELHIPGHQLDFRGQSHKVPHRHDVVDAVDADALAAQPVGEPLAGPVGEDLILDPRVAVLADVARLRREDDRRVAFDAAARRTRSGARS